MRERLENVSNTDPTSPQSQVPPMAAAASCQHALRGVDWLLSDLLMLSSTSLAAAIG